MKAQYWLIGVVAFAIVAPACTSTTTLPSASVDQVNRALAVAPQEDSVATPAGWRPRSCVHEIPNGAYVSATGLVRRVDGSTFQLAACSRSSEPTIPRLGRWQTRLLGPADSSWMEWTVDTLASGNTFHHLNATWKVPPVPSGSYSGTQVYYTFPGFQNGYFIVQPVIQYGYNGDFGGSYWTAASWRCHNRDNCHHGTPIVIYPGDSIVGNMILHDCVGTACTWLISTIDVTQGTHSDWSVSDEDIYAWSTGGAVEVYGLTSCNQYPSVGVFYKGISLTDKYSSSVSPTWEKHFQSSPNPSCNFSIDATAATVSLYHAPDLANYISNDSTSYFTARASGGFPSYSYYWEWCADECGGDGPSLAKSVRPLTVEHGWQVLDSTIPTVYWTMSGSILRSTVTDSRSGQVVATYALP
jgi:hypothetical protein